MMLINRETKAVEEQTWRKENWIGDGWIEVPDHLKQKAADFAPYCELIFETVTIDNVKYDLMRDVLPVERPAKDLLPLQNDKQEQNNAALAIYLTEHPMQWKDGKFYGVSQADQQEISLNIMQYQMAVQAGLPAILEWHAVHEECREWTLEELSGLALAMTNYVYPLVKHNQAIKAEIYETKTLEELEAIQIEYE